MGKSVTNNIKICILLTATVDPKGVPFMKRSDPIVRESDYINSMKKWLETTPYSVVFCENSGYKGGKIGKMVKSCEDKKCEFLQFDGQDFPREFGKGYGELQTIKYAVQNSNIVKESNHTIKVNGRYFIKNIEKILCALSSTNKDIYVMADLKNNLTWADSRIFAFKPSFITDYLSKYQNLINDSKGFYLEHALARAILRAVSDGYRWTPLPSNPIIVGYSGTSDTPYTTSKIHWLAGEVIHRTKNYFNRRF